MTSPGQELKQDREARGISLKAVADTTRISRRYLEAVESDRLDLLPGGFFIKGILRAYAGAVGLDEAAVLERYRRAGVLAAGPQDTARKQLRRRRPIEEADPLHGRRGGRPHRHRQLRRLFPDPAGEDNRPPSGRPNLPRRRGPRPSRSLRRRRPWPRSSPPNPKRGSGSRSRSPRRRGSRSMPTAGSPSTAFGRPGTRPRSGPTPSSSSISATPAGLPSRSTASRAKPFGRSGAVVKNIRITPENMSDLPAAGRDRGRVRGRATDGRP